MNYIRGRRVAPSFLQKKKDPIIEKEER